VGQRAENLRVKDVAAAGRWKDVTTLINCYQQPDEETLRSVVEYERPRIQTQVRTAVASQQAWSRVRVNRTGSSSVEAFAGGPKPLRRMGHWKSRDEALEWLKQQECSPFTEEEK
jgi:hypothetical protein